MSLNSYDHHAAIYYLLLERLRQHRSSAPSNEKSQPLDAQRRRPSTIAEQAMRKLGLAPLPCDNVGTTSSQPRGFMQRAPPAPSYSGSAHSSTDEGVETDPEPDPPVQEYPVNSPAPPVGSTGLTHHLSSDSGASQASTSFSPFESLECALDTELAVSLPSCTSPTEASPNTTLHGTSASAIHPSVPNPAGRVLLRHNPIGAGRTATRSPVDFREGRRASDGLVAQGAMGHSSMVPFSQRLLDTGRVHGELELNQVRLEHRVLRHQVQNSSLLPEQLLQRQIQHSQYQQERPPLPKRISLPENFSFGGALDGEQGAMLGGMNRPPALQQQLLQHRLLQKRQILQRQAAAGPPSVENSLLARRHMVRQASYKLAQQQQVLPPLPGEAVPEDESWLALPSSLAAACSISESANPDQLASQQNSTQYSTWHQVQQ